MRIAIHRKTDCYVDTSAFIALLDASDEHHSLFNRLFAAPPPMVTSSLVIAEGHGWFLRKYDVCRAMLFLTFIQELPRLSIEAFDKATIPGATVLLRKFSDQKLTLADAHGLQLMKQRSLRCCWSSDRHMGLTGVALAIRELS